MVGSSFGYPWDIQRTGAVGSVPDVEWTPIGRYDSVSDHVYFRSLIYR